MGNKRKRRVCLIQSPHRQSIAMRILDEWKRGITQWEEFSAQDILSVCGTLDPIQKPNISSGLRNLQSSRKSKLSNPAKQVAGQKILTLWRDKADGWGDYSEQQIIAVLVRLTPNQRQNIRNGVLLIKRS